MNQDIPIDELHRIFEYDPESGSLIYRSRASTRASAGSKAGFLNHKGYRLVGISGKQYRAHRIIVAMTSGDWPPAEFVIDHIDGNRDNNRIENLRVCSHSENQHNRISPSSSTSGLLGASYSKKERKWIAAICVGGKRMRIGGYKTPGEARSACLEAKTQLHPTAPIRLTNGIDKNAGVE